MATVVLLADPLEPESEVAQLLSYYYSSNDLKL